MVTKITRRNKGKKRLKRVMPSMLEMLEARQLLSTYYVSTGGNDSGGGTSSAPYRTLEKGAGVLGAGDTLIVNPGNYTGFSIGYNWAQNGTASAPITIKAQPGVNITGRGPDTPDGIDVEGNYIIIDGFNVNNADGSISRCGIRVVSATNDTVRNNNVNNAGTWGIFTGFAPNVLIENNIASNSINQHGIYVSNSGDYPTVRGNSVYGNRQSGIQINADASMGGDGLIQGAVVENNIIYNNGVAGGGAINWDGVVNSIIRNNLLYDNHASGIALFKADGATGSTNNLIVNNTIINADSSRWAVTVQNGSTGNTFYNNIIYNKFVNRGAMYFSPDSISGTQSDYNIYDGRFTTTDGDVILSLSQWRTTLGGDQHSMVGTLTGLFVNAAGNDYHLASASSAIDAGTSTSAPATDLAGDPRPSGSGYDIGAYEMQVATTLPAAPSSLVASSLSSVQIKLTWTDNANSETGFKILRATGSGSFVQIASLGRNLTSFTDTGLTSATAYSYRVCATNGLGDSAYSNTASATTAIPNAPAAPSSLTALVISPSQINLSWTDNSDNETGFKIERAVGGGVFAAVTTVGAGVSSFINSGLAAGTAYTYRVSATNAVGDSAYSNTAAGTTLAAGTITFWGPTTTPAVASDSDTVAVELGLKFSSTSAGTITGLRYYKSSFNTGTHVGHVWSSTGQLLASATFTNESDSGWQTVMFSQAVAIAANTTYVASYNAPAGHYSSNSNYFTSAGVTSGPLTATNSVYTYGTNVFPTSTYNNTNYWVDILYAGSTAPTFPVAPSGVTATAASSSQINLKWTDNSSDETGFRIERATGGGAFAVVASVGANVTTYADSGLSASTAYSYRMYAVNAVGASTYSNTASATTAAAIPGTPSGLVATAASSSQIGLKWTDNANNETGFKIERAMGTGAYAVIAQVGANVTTYADSGLSASTAYSYRVYAVTATIASAYSNTATATTMAASGTTSSIWGNTAVPANPSATNDTNQVELGLKFRSSVAGSVMGVRFYKGASNTGTHVGHLWSSTGRLLASVTFTNETASGWQTAMFSQPVAISANTTYVISYNAPKGGYAWNSNYFTSAGMTSGSLKAINSTYAYGANVFPTSNWQNANYWVDVVFKAA